jgi:hypothetical protein
MRVATNLVTRLTITLLVGLSSTIVIAGQERTDTKSEPPRVIGIPRIDRDYRAPARTVLPTSRLRWVNEFEPDSSEKKLLMVDPSDETTFAQILAQPGTGIIRLLPFYSNRGVVSVAEPEAYRRPGFTYFAATYSFSKRKHGSCLNGWHVSLGLGWAELRLKDGILGAAITEDSMGLMVRLGDVPLESVTIQTAGVAELNNLTPPADHIAAKTIFENSLRGVKVGEFTYGSRIPANLNATYALRSTMRGRADVLVAFRVVRKDSDGNITLLWKKLKDFPKPSWKKKDKK